MRGCQCGLKCFCLLLSGWVAVSVFFTCCCHCEFLFAFTYCCLGGWLSVFSLLLSLWSFVYLSLPVVVWVVLCVIYLLLSCDHFVYFYLLLSGCVSTCRCHCDLLCTWAYLLLSGWVLLWIQVPVGVEVPSPCPPLFQCYHTAKCHI